MSIAGFLPAVSLLAGAIAGVITSPEPRALIWILPLACVTAIVAWWRRVTWLVMIALAVGLAAAGAALAGDALEKALHPSVRARLDDELGGFRIEADGPGGRHDPLPSRLLLVEDASVRDGFVSLRAQLRAISLRGSWTRVEGGITISVSGATAADHVAEWRAGRTIEAPVTFRRPARYLNEGVADFERDLALDGISLLGSVKSGLSIAIVDRGGRLSEFAADIRAHVRHAVGTWIGRHDPVSGAIAAAVLIGDRAGLPDEVRDRLQMAGTYHVIAISGGNIAILAAAATLILMVAGVRGRHAAAVAIVVLAGYVLVIASGPSVWRATVMAVLYFAARAIDHRTAPWHTAAMAAAVMIATRPLDVRDAGFILTFGATIALLYGARVGTALMPRSRFLSWLVASLVASIAVEVVLLPASARLFSQVTVAGLLLNLVAVPLMGVVQIAALIVALVVAIPSVAIPAGYAAHLAAQALVYSSQLVTIAPWVTARVPPPSMLVLAAYYAALVVTMTCRGRVLRTTAVGTMATTMVVICGLIVPTDLIGEGGSGGLLRLTMFDVGQGESMLLEMPDRERMLIDAGGMPFGGGVEIGRRVLEPALWARDLRSLDTVVITHGDPDHIGGAPDVVADFAPRALWMGVPVPMHAPTRELAALAERQGASVELRRAGEIVHKGDIVVRVLHPPEPDWERRRVRNDDSIVLEVVYRDVAILLTGDIGAEIERAILPRLTPARTRILKVAHHGSRTSSSMELLDDWRPQIALISAGRGNTFGHPAPEVMERLEAIDSTVFRTDLDGRITLETNGRDLSVTTFTGD